MHNLNQTMLPQVTDPAGGGAGDPPTKQEPEKNTWETVLAGLSENVRQLYEEHTGGLKSALTSEREKSKGVADRLKKLAELEETEKKRQEKDLSEAQKAAAKLAEIERERDELAEKLATTRIRSAVEVQAGALGFQSPEDAYQMADLSEVKIDDDGKVTGVDDALKELVKAKPYLLKTAGTKGAPETDSGRKSTTGQLTLEEIKNRKRRGYSPL